MVPLRLFVYVESDFLEFDVSTRCGLRVLVPYPSYS